MLVFGEINLLYFSASEPAVGDSDVKDDPPASLKSYACYVCPDAN